MTFASMVMFFLIGLVVDFISLLNRLCILTPYSNTATYRLGMVPKNCLSAVLNRLTVEGGYLVVRLSANWGGVHVLWMHPNGELEQYSPPTKLKSPWQAFFGFDGVWKRGDRSSFASPIPTGTLVLNSWVLALGTTVWAVCVGVSSMYKKLRTK